jgi:hypothetical protein
MPEKMAKMLADLSQDEVLDLSNDDAKVLMSAVVMEYRDALERSVSYVVEKLEEMAADNMPVMADDMIIGINLATNSMCFTNEINAGALAVAQLELARLRMAAKS